MVNFTIGLITIFLMSSIGAASSISRRDETVRNNKLKTVGQTPEKTNGKPNTHQPKNKDHLCQRAIAIFTGVSRGIEGSFRFTEIQGGATTVVELHVSGLPLGAEYTYHIHERGVQMSDCSTALGYFNPTNVTSKACDYYAPQHCATGDMSGKFGKLAGGDVKLRYYDPSLKFGEGPNSIIDRSIVIQGPDHKRLACGNIIFAGFRPNHLRKGGEPVYGFDDPDFKVTDPLYALDNPEVRLQEST